MIQQRPLTELLWLQRQAHARLAFALSCVADLAGEVTRINAEVEAAAARLAQEPKP